MKLLLDENLGRSVARELRKQGHDILAIGDEFAGVIDSAVLAKARHDKRVLITRDKDFGELAFKVGQAHCGVILLRLIDEQAGNTLRVIENVLLWLGKRKGSFFVVATDSEFRVRIAG